MYQDKHCTKTQDHSLDKALDNQIIRDAREVIDAKGECEPLELSYRISNVDRSVGAMVGSEISRVGGADGLREGRRPSAFDACKGGCGKEGQRPLPSITRPG